MGVSEKLIRKYAELIVRTGANVQPGQVVSLTASVEQHAFAAMITEACYQAGAKKVNVDWQSDDQTRLHFLHAEQETLATVLPWEEAKMKQMVEDLPCRIYIVSDEEAIETARDLARLEGIMCGISSGTNVAAALKLAEKLGEGKTVVTVLPDTAERYFSTVLFEE